MKTSDKDDLNERMVKATEKIVKLMQAKEDRKDEKRKRDLDMGAPHSVLFRGHYGL